MKIVGEKLEEIAVLERDKDLQNLFGRSAFNRYYYAAFLITREMLGELNNAWKKTAHSEIPNLLETSVRKQPINNLKLSAKKELITSGEFSRLNTSLTNATAELANLLRQAYDVRVIADYEPDQIIVVKGKVISLHSIKLTSANTWMNRANSFCKDIRKVWKEAGLA